MKICSNKHSTQCALHGCRGCPTISINTLHSNFRLPAIDRFILFLHAYECNGRFFSSHKFPLPSILSDAVHYQLHKLYHLLLNTSAVIFQLPPQLVLSQKGGMSCPLSMRELKNSEKLFHSHKLPKTQVTMYMYYSEPVTRQYR